MRNLNFYIKNLFKIKEIEKKKIKDLKEKITEIKKQTKEIISVYNNKMKYNKIYTSQINKKLKEQQKIDQIVI